MKNLKLIDSIAEYEKSLGVSENIFQGNLLSDEEKKFVMQDSNAFLFGLLADQSVRAEIAWSLPHKLFLRLGHFSMESIITDYTMEDLQNILRSKPALHRYPGNMGRYLWLAAEKLVTEYHASAKEIWTDATAQTIVERLEQFVGISHKKALLARLLLWRDLNVDIPEKQNIDIIYDIHIRRIFLRAGFCNKDTQKDAVEAARRINPDFPGYLTSALWAIGREICCPTNPLCNECPISLYCERKIDIDSNG